MGPAGIPETVVKKLSADLDATLKTPAVSQKMLDMGVIPMPMSAQEFKAYAEQERSAWADVIKKANIKLE
ncbi:Tripartite tricarboxylate transporter family receptor [compost metagenome]